MTFRETAVKIKALRTRWAITQMYKNHPDRAVAHVNALLSEASRQEENRQNILEGSL